MFPGWTCSDCARVLLSILHARRLRVHWTPGIPHALVWAERSRQKLGASCRGNMRLCLSRHGPPTTIQRGASAKAARIRPRNGCPCEALQVVLLVRRNGCCRRRAQNHTSTVSSPSVRLKSATIGIEAPGADQQALPCPTPRSARAWRPPAASMFQSSAIAGALEWSVNSHLQSAGSRAVT